MLCSRLMLMLLASSWAPWSRDDLQQSFVATVKHKATLKEHVMVRCKVMCIVTLNFFARESVAWGIRNNLMFLHVTGARGNMICDAQGRRYTWALIRKRFGAENDERWHVSPKGFNEYASWPLPPNIAFYFVLSLSCILCCLFIAVQFFLGQFLVCILEATSPGSLAV